MPNNIPAAVRKKVKQRADGYCEWCGKKIENLCNLHLEQHHIVKRRHRIHTAENLIVLCSPVTFKNTCHYKAEKKELGLKLKLMLQEHYKSKGYSGEKLRELMGGKIYTGGDQ